MSALESFEAQPREKAGTGTARAARRLGMIPGIIYGDHKEPELINVDLKSVTRELHSASFFSRVFKVITGKKSVDVIVRDIQLHPVTDQPLHIDFQRVNKDSKITVAVPVIYVNEDKSPGLKRGGTLNIIIHNLEVKCSPVSIPESLTFDLSGLEANHSVRLEELKLPNGVVPAYPARDKVIATIVPPAASPEAKA